ncbi:MAG TPA: OmpH family outer membrane protein [Bryobacteraceae bacterium]|nr:OmpH family outer membrane protein [Bryobacteraceae bacterium]
MCARTGLRLSLACFALFGAAQVASAQAKIAVVNMQRAVLESAEIKKANGEMEARYKPRQAEIEKLQRDLQNIDQQLQANAGKMTPQAQADMTADGQRKQRDLRRLTEDLQQDVERDRNEILGRSSQKMQEVVRKLAEEKGLDMVVDVTNTVFFKPALEITNEALAAYDKANPPK